MHGLIFVRKPFVWLVPFLAPVRHRHNARRAEPTHSFDIAIANRTLVGPWKLVELSGVAPRPAGFVELAHPEHGGDLRDDRNAPVIDRHPRIIDEGERGRQRDGPGVGPTLSFLLEHLHTPTAWLPALRTTFALIAFAQRQHIVL